MSFVDRKREIVQQIIYMKYSFCKNSNKHKPTISVILNDLPLSPPNGLEHSSRPENGSLQLSFARFSNAWDQLIKSGLQLIVVRNDPIGTQLCNWNVSIAKRYSD